ncbi:MAG: KEOPS complex kinase/ATPase Bud32 [Thermoplasmata archaeon]|nr:KEOPS complex kinase/ATPase Bud32 [Thermoplasmata archaeon]
MSGTASGAEAIVAPVVFLGRDAVEKVRPPKTYRLPELDSHIRTSRTRAEARIMHEARAAGVRTPCVYDIDLSRCSITMERMDGPTVKAHLDEHPEDAPAVCKEIGRTVARLHSAGICHGDLTTSNMILCPDGTVCLLDLSMGKTRAELEDIGVDLRLLERAFSSAHVDLPDAFAGLMEEYYANIRDPKAVARKLEDIRNRGRYT